jgi:hypothetical protein
LDLENIILAGWLSKKTISLVSPALCFCEWPAVAKQPSLSFYLAMKSSINNDDATAVKNLQYSNKRFDGC